MCAEESSQSRGKATVTVSKMYPGLVLIRYIKVMYGNNCLCKKSLLFKFPKRKGHAVSCKAMSEKARVNQKEGLRRNHGNELLLLSRVKCFGRNVPYWASKKLSLSTCSCDIRCQS